MPDGAEVSIEGKVLKVSNLDKVLYPEVGFTKGAVIDYYTRIAPMMLPHLAGRPLTLKRYPNGVNEKFFYEKNSPKHRPEWLHVIPIEQSKRIVEYTSVDSTPGLVWVANMAGLEIHPLLSREEDLTRPTKITFDLDPGAPATIVECCQIAIELRALLQQLGLECFAKTSGSKGMQIDVPLNTKATFDETKQFAHVIAQLLEKRMPKRVVSKMDKALRKNKIFIDWSQNDDNKTTVSVYSLRAKSQPTVSTPITWDEVGVGAGGVELSFLSSDVLERVEQLGDLHAGVETIKQSLPDLSAL